jgi:hypothetical protein
MITSLSLVVYNGIGFRSLGLGFSTKNEKRITKNKLRLLFHGQIRSSKTFPKLSLFSLSAAQAMPEHGHNPRAQGKDD